MSTIIVYHETPKRGNVGYVYRDAESLQKKLASLRRRHIEAVVTVMETGERVGSVEEVSFDEWNWWFDPSAFQEVAK